MRTVSCLLALCLVCVPRAAGDNWPQFRGPTGDGHATASDLPTTWSEADNVRWKTAIHDKGWSSPVVWGEQIWMTTARADGKAFYAVCVDRKSGNVVHDIKLFTEENPAFCHEFNSYATPTPAVEEGRVYAHFGSHGTLCLDTATGKTLWERHDLKCDHWRGPGSSPIVWGDLLVLTFDGYDTQYITALNKRDGTTAWKKDRAIKYTTNNPDLYKAYSTPSVFEIGGKPQLISPSAEATIAYDPASGSELWRVHHGGMNQAAKPVYGHGLLYLSSGHTSAVLAVKPGGEGVLPADAVVWKTLKAGPSRPSFLLTGDLIFWVSDNGIAACVDAKTGRKHWQERLGGAFSASPTLAEGRVYVSDQEGRTHVLAADKEYKSLAVNKLDAGCMASPAVTGNEIYLRTKTHLYCIAKK